MHPNALSKAEFCAKLKELHGEDYKLIGKFNGFKFPNSFQHVCGKKFTVLGTSILKGAKCPCLRSTGSYAIDKSRAQKKLDTKFGPGEYKILGEYLGSATLEKHLFKHSCGKKFEVRLANLMSGEAKCPCLHNKISQVHTSIELHNEEIAKIRGPDWICVEYNSRRRIQNVYKHIPCGKTFKTVWYSFQKSQFCPFCEGWGTGTHREIELKGKVFRYQGHEGLTLKWLVKRFKPKSICTSLEPGRLEIDYRFEKKQRKYLPDFFIATANLIIETKCLSTMGLNDKGGHIYHRKLYDKTRAKALACMEQGFKFQLDLYSDDGSKKIKLPKNWMEMNRKALQKHLE